MRYLIIFLLGGALGAAVCWYVTEARRDFRVRIAERRALSHVENVGESIKEQVSQINVDAIREELARTGRVIRQKAQQATSAFKDDGADARTAADLRARLAADARLAARGITVTVRQGQVTLAGVVGSHEEIARAMQLALATDGVREVVSELQVRVTR